MTRMISDDLPPGERFAELFDGGVPPDPAAPGQTYTDQVGLDLTSLPLDVLLGLRAEIDAALPPMRLSEVNLEEELVLQYRTAKALQTATLSDANIEANKKSQVLNSVAATLQQLIKMQAEFHTAERFKQLEGLLIDSLRALPQEAADKFLAHYEQALGAMQ